MNQYSAFHLQYLPKGTQVYIQGCAHEWHLDGARCKTLLSLCLPPSWFHQNGSPKTPISLNGCFNIQKLCCCSFFASSCRWQLSCYLQPQKKNNNNKHALPNNTENGESDHLWDVWVNHETLSGGQYNTVMYTQTKKEFDYSKWPSKRIKNICTWLWVVIFSFYICWCTVCVQISIQAFQLCHILYALHYASCPSIKLTLS